MAYAIANTNTTGTQFSGTTGGSLAYPNNVTLGNVLFAGSSSWGQGSTTHSCSGGGVWVRDLTYNGTNVRISGHSCGVASGGATTVTLAVGATMDCSLSLVEMSHTAATDLTVDKTAQNRSNSNSTAESTGTTAATTSTDGVAICHFTNEGTSTSTQASGISIGYAAFYNIGDNGKMPLCSTWRALSSMATAACSLTWVNAPWAALIVTYKAVAAAPPAAATSMLALLGVGAS